DRDRAALWRDLERIRDEVRHDLDRTLAVAIDRGKPRRRGRLETESTFLRHRTEDVARRGQNLFRVVQLPVDRELTRLDAGEVDEVFDQARHSLGLTVNPLGNRANAMAAIAEVDIEQR